MSTNTIWKISRLIFINKNPLTNTEEEYRGDLQIQEGVLSFKGGSVLVSSITQVSNYPIKPDVRISFGVLFFAFIIGYYSLIGFIGYFGVKKYMNNVFDKQGEIVTPMLNNTGIDASELLKLQKDIYLGIPSIFNPYLLFFVFIVCGAVFAFGVYERTRSGKQGITVEIASGFKHYFIGKSKTFIDAVYSKFVLALQNNTEAFRAVFNDAIIIEGSGTTVYKNSSIDNSTGKTEINNTGGDVNVNSHNTDNSISVGDGNKTGDIGHNNNIGNNSFSGGSTAGNINNNQS